MRPRFLAFCLLTVLAIRPVVVIASDRTRFDGAVKNFAPPFAELFDPTGPFKPKGLCVCTPGLEPGFLYREIPGSGDVLCAQPIFAGDGTFLDVAVTLRHVPDTVEVKSQPSL